VANYLAGARQAVGLATNGAAPQVNHNSSAAAPEMAGPIPPQPGRPHLMKILELLARVEMDEDEEPFATWAQRAAVPLAWGTTVIAITPDAGEATCRGLHGLVRSGLNVVLLVVEPYGQFSLVQERARLLGFQAFLVASEADLTRLQALDGRVAARQWRTA
jgi:hypothetical protein